MGQNQILKKPLLPNWSFYGTGISLTGYRPQGDGTYLATRWITVLFFPLIPLNSWVISPVKAGVGPTTIISGIK